MGEYSERRELKKFSRFTLYLEPSSFHTGAFWAERRPVRAWVIASRMVASLGFFIFSIRLMVNSKLSMAV